MPIKAVVSTNANVQSYDDTPIEQDMANMEEANYPANSFGKPSIVGFMEYCYSNNSAYSTYYGLYVYVYNPTEKPLIVREGANQITLSNAFGEDGKRSSTKDYSLTYLDNTDNYRFYKFKVTDSSEQYNLAKEYASLWNDRRRYEITSLDIRFEGEASRKSFDILKIYEYSGFASWCGEPSLAINTLQCQYYGGQDVHLQVRDTNYRFAHKGDNLYDDLQSVYFSLPNEYSDQWGNLSMITAEWYQYKTSPMFVTTDMGAYSALFNMRNKRINEYGQLIDESGNVLSQDIQTYWRVLWEETWIQAEYNLHIFEKGYNPLCREDIEDDKWYDGTIFGDDSYNYALGSDLWEKDFEFLNRIDWIFPIEKEITSLEDYQVSSEKVRKYIERYAEAYPEQDKLMDKYPINLFERYSGDGYKCNSFQITDVKQFVDTSENQSLWEKLWGIKSTESKNYNPIVTISEGDIYLSNEDFSAKYYVNIEDAEDVKNFVGKSYDNNETPILLRFAKTDYYASAARFDYAEEDKFDMSGVDGYVAQEHVFLNFDILSLEYTSEDGFTKTLVDVVADSIDIINGLTAPENIPIEEEEWWQKIISILLLILFFVFITPVMSILFPIFKIIFKAIGVCLGVVFNILTFPLRLIFNRKRE